MAHPTQLHSMTGFGRASLSRGSVHCTVEMRGVNHRYLEVKVKAPQELNSLEAEWKKLLQKKIHRGRVEVSIRVENQHGMQSRPQLNLEQAEQYQRLFAELCENMNEPVTSLEPKALFQLPGVLTLEETPAFEEGALAELARETFLLAMEPFCEMRRLEGEHLREDLYARVSSLGEGLALMRSFVAEEPQSLLARMKSRLEQWLPEAGLESIEPQRLHQEVALLADKADVSEELTRLQSHLRQFQALLQGGGEVGRRLDFLCQELHREWNTIGSKSHHERAVELLIEMKAEGNKLREQVQNVE